MCWEKDVPRSSPLARLVQGGTSRRRDPAETMAGKDAGQKEVVRVMSWVGVRVVSRLKTCSNLMGRPAVRCPDPWRRIRHRSADSGRPAGRARGCGATDAAPRQSSRRQRGRTPLLCDPHYVQRDTVESSHGRGPRPGIFEGVGRPALPYRFITAAYENVVTPPAPVSAMRKNRLRPLGNVAGRGCGLRRTPRAPANIRRTPLLCLA